MKLKKITSRTDVHSGLPFTKPGIISLLAHIARSALTEGMLWFVCLGGAVIAFLAFNHLPVRHLPVLMIFTVMLVALMHGIRSWQQDLDTYRKNLTDYRMNMADIRNRYRVKSDMIWDRH